jgi:hypothetical protein
MPPDSLYFDSCLPQDIRGRAGRGKAAHNVVIINLIVGKPHEGVPTCVVYPMWIRAMLHKKLDGAMNRFIILL